MSVNQGGGRVRDLVKHQLKARAQNQKCGSNQ